MMPHRLSRIAIFLLRALLRGRDPLAGDLLEEFDAGRSRTWLWRQAFAAAVLAPPSTRRPAAPLALGLAEERDERDGPRPCSPAAAVTRPVNLTGSPIHGVGGLGLVAFGLLVTLVRPDAWTFALYGPIGGIAVALALGLARRHRQQCTSAGIRTDSTHPVRPRHG